MVLLLSLDVDVSVEESVMYLVTVSFKVICVSLPLFRFFSLSLVFIHLSVKTLV